MENLIIEHINKANNKHFNYGVTWYEDVRGYCKTLAEAYNKPLFQIVAALAALSPRNRWDRNKIDLISVLKHGNKAKVGTFNKMKEKAILCLQSKNEYEVRSILNGQKIQSFFDNIYHINDSSVTVDVWAMRVVGFKDNLTPKRYREIEKAYQNVASMYGLMPKQVQAITWGVVRNG